MINRIVASYILFACLFAIALYLGGIHEPIHLSTYFRSFLNNASYNLSQYKFEIPTIDYFPTDQIRLVMEGENIFEAFINFVVGYYSFLNFLLTIINGLISLVNMIVQLLQIIFFFVKALFDLKDDIILAQ